jgi:hypothetical protein
LAKTVTSQQSGVFCFAESGVERRVVLRDGALVTAASSADEESLLSFLVMRGDLPKDKAQRLSQKVPGFGRHAAAALVARGYLAQENLPGVLRAHAEWILAHVAAMKDGILTVERSPSGRLLAEAAVFDPREGYEVLVDLARRSVSTAEALSRMGGAGGRLGEGNLWHVLGHCGLGPQVQSAVQQVAQGMSLKEAKLVSDTDDFLTIVYALTELGVLQIAKAIFEDGETTTSKVELQDPLEEAAVRTRILGKKQVVDEGDYFAVLGVDPFATPYEIRRAFLEMRRSFDPSRILTPNLASLAEDVRHIISVAEEAYEILRDDARRERYRRAIGLEEKSSE